MFYFSISSILIKVVSVGPEGTSGQREVHLGYTNGNHYSSVRKIGDSGALPTQIQLLTVTEPSLPVSTSSPSVMEIVAALPSDSSPPKSVPESEKKTLDEWKEDLIAFQYCCLKGKQTTFISVLIAMTEFQILGDKKKIASYEDLFGKKIFLEYKDPLYHSWLPLKFASLGQENEAFERVLSSQTPTNLPKRKVKRKQNLPSGADRYNPMSDAWKDIFSETEAKKSKPAPPAEKKAKPAPPAEKVTRSKKRVSGATETTSLRKSTRKTAGK